MVTSPNEWKIFEWDENLQTNKQTNKQKQLLIFLFILWWACWYANMSPSNKKLMKSLWYSGISLKVHGPLVKKCHWTDAWFALLQLQCCGVNNYKDWYNIQNHGERVRPSCCVDLSPGCEKSQRFLWNTEVHPLLLQQPLTSFNSS